MQIYFLQPVLIIFTRGAIYFDHDCIWCTKKTSWFFWALHSLLLHVLNIGHSKKKKKHTSLFPLNDMERNKLV